MLLEGTARRRCSVVASPTSLPGRSLPFFRSPQLPPEADPVNSCLLVFGFVYSECTAAGRLRSVPRSSAGDLELNPEQRDGHSEIRDFPEAAAGGREEPVGGKGPCGRGGWGSTSLVLMLGDAGMRTFGTDMGLSWGPASVPGCPL